MGPSLETPTRVDCSEYFSRILNAGDDATRSGVSHRFAMAGLPLCIRFGCAELERQFLPALCHLSPISEPDRKATESLTITVWGGTQADAVLCGTPWDENDDRSLGYDCVRGERGMITLNRDTNFIHLYDRTQRKASVWLPDVNTVQVWDRAAPFIKLLNWWLADHGVDLVHAAAVGTPNAAVLLVGKGGSGKSTAAVSSLTSSLGYLGDDYVAVEGGDTPRVFSMFNSAKLEPAQLAQHFPQHQGNVRQINDDFGEKALLYVSETDPDKLLQTSPLKAVIVPEITTDSAPTLRECSPAVAFRALAPSTIFQLPGNTREKFRTLTALTRRLPAYRLRLSPDLDRNIGAVEAFLKG